MKIQNKTNRKQAVPGIPAFAPYEKRSVDKETAQILLACPFFAEVKEEKTKEKSKKSSNS